jgi:hypothetical protein
MIEGRKETEIGIIPSEWNCPSIREISIRCKAGGTPRKNQKELWENGNIPFVLIEDMTSVLMYLKETKNFINQKGLESCSAWLVPKDTVLLSMYATVGKAVINKIPVATNQAILAIVTKPEVCKEFLAFALDNDSQRLLSYNVQSTQKNVNKGIVEQFKIPLPPPPRTAQNRPRIKYRTKSHRAAGQAHPHHHRAEKSTHAKTLYRRHQRRTPERNRNRFGTGELVMLSQTKREIHLMLV